ncbi:MAG: putative bifunctional diguanylate cyclase/phosphodiesterase [Rhodospirillaceae bacterium]
MSHITQSDPPADPPAQTVPTRWIPGPDGAAVISEQRRIAALHSLGILDTEPEPRFDRLTELSRKIFGVAKSWIALIDEERQWLKSIDGVPGLEMDRRDSLCDNAVRANATLIIPDIAADPYFRDLPAVRSMGVGFYAGAVLRDEQGLPMGTFCIGDISPRSFSDQDESMLLTLAALAQDELLRNRDHENIRATVIARAFSDAQTGLPDGAYASAILSRHLQDHDACAVAVASFDHRDRILRGFGHKALAQITQETAKRLQSYGGDHLLAYRGEDAQFVIIHGSVDDRTQALGALERVCRAASTELEVDGVRIPVRLRAGLVFSDDCPRGDEPTKAARRAPENPVAEAETMLSSAARARPEDHEDPNRLVGLEDQAAGERVRRWLDLSTRLNDPELTNQLTLLYQPKVNAFTNQISGFEALVRWQRPDGSFISPADFIPVAEETGAIGPIGAWVTKVAASCLCQWCDASKGGEIPPVAVNVAAPQLLDPGFEADIAQLVDGLGLGRGLLHLELTETALLADMGEARKLLQRLRDAGFHIALDDFGTGYSSLGYLQDVPAHALKLDRTFIMDLAHSRRQRVLVKSIIRMAQALDMVVIGEGVETPDQFRILRDMGCDQIQGYLFAKPLPVAQATEYALGTARFQNPLKAS